MNIRAIIGPMFAGKTTFILASIKQLIKGGKKIAVFTSTKNTRSDYIESHTGEKYECKKISYEELIHIDFDYDFVFIDEIQFFSPEIINFISKQKCKFIISGLDRDFNAKYFPTYIEILNNVPFENIHYLKSICKCGNFAVLTKLKDKIFTEKENNILIGGDDLYEASCLNCF